MKWNRTALVILVVFFLGALAGFHLKSLPFTQGAANVVHLISNIDVRQVPGSSTRFTSPLLECAESAEATSDATVDSIREDIQEVITSRQKKGDISYASVYFRDLNNGPWFGINEDEKFFPASLLKLPLAMSFYDKSEDDASLLSREITYTPNPEVTSQLQPFGGSNTPVAGKKYTVQYLLDLMLKESSNEAAATLAGVAGQAVIGDVYQALGLDLPQPGKDYRISTHRYASFFRILYNATYVDRVSSERILSALSDATFKDGLVAGVPRDIPVAHKFGSRKVENSDKVQLHDCGIIYATKKPYILCVMTQGTDFDRLAETIRSISSAAYSGITSM